MRGSNRPTRSSRFKDALTADPRLDVKVIRETEYYEAQSRTLTTRSSPASASSIALLMAIGAIFGALNTMYSAVATRTREIATLRALGFRRRPGGRLGAGRVAVPRSRSAASSAAAVAYFGVQRLPDLDDELVDVQPGLVRVRGDAALLVMGIAYALLMGLIGGLFPAIRAARLPVATALREL